MADRQRLDKWLFFARALKSRTLAQKVIAGGQVRVNGERCVDADRSVGAGDVLTMDVHGRLLVWRILDAGDRRGPASEAAGLYEDLSPPIDRFRPDPLDRPQAQREPGSGRPTKRERRETDRLLGDDGNET